VTARFSAPVQTSPGAHPAFYTMGTGSFPGVKRPGLDVDHPPHPAQRLKLLIILTLARFKYELPDDGQRPKHVGTF